MLKVLLYVALVTALLDVAWWAFCRLSGRERTRSGTGMALNLLARPFDYFLNRPSAGGSTASDQQPPQSPGKSHDTMAMSDGSPAPRGTSMRGDASDWLLALGGGAVLVIAAAAFTTLVNDAPDGAAATTTTLDYLRYDETWLEFLESVEAGREDPGPFLGLEQAWERLLPAQVAVSDDAKELARELARTDAAELTEGQRVTLFERSWQAWFGEVPSPDTIEIARRMWVAVWYYSCGGQVGALRQLRERLDLETTGDAMAVAAMSIQSFAGAETLPVLERFFECDIRDALAEFDA